MMYPRCFRVDSSAAKRVVNEVSAVSRVDSSFAKRVSNELSISDIFTPSTVPVTTIFPVTVKFPLANVPVVLKFSSPKLILPPKSVMEPLANIKLPSWDSV